MPGPIAGVGVPGLPGTNGTGDAYYEHHQSIPSTHWIVYHGLGKIPAITVMDYNGTVYECGRQDDDIDPYNIAHLYFGAALPGRAVCS